MTARCSFDPCAGRSCVWGTALPRGVGRFKMASALLWPYSAERIFLFRVCRALRSAPNAFSRVGAWREAAFAAPASCGSAALRRKLLLGASGLNPLRHRCAMPPPPKGGGLFVLTGRYIKAPPERKDFPRPGEDVAQRQKGESGRDQRERTERVSRPLGEGGCDQREQTEGVVPRHPAL